MIYISPATISGFGSISDSLTNIYKGPTTGPIVAPSSSSGSSSGQYTNETVNFIDNNGNQWSGGQVEYGNDQSANCGIPAGAVSARLTINVVSKPTGTGCASILNASILTSKGTFKILDTGGDCHVGLLTGAKCTGVPTFSLSGVDISSMIDFTNDTNVVLDMTGCSVTELPVGTNIQWNFNNAFIIFEVPAIENVGTVSVSAQVQGTLTNGIDITLLNKQTQQSVSATTGAGGAGTGIAAFGQIDVGSYTIEASYGTFADISQSVDVVTGANNFTIAFKCPSGTTYCGGNCVQNCGTGSQLNTSTCQCENTTVSGVVNPLIILVAVVGLAMAAPSLSKGISSYETRKAYKGKEMK